MRAWVVAILAACAPEVSMRANLQHANLRVPYQTDPRGVLVFPGDVDEPYDVLSDLEVHLRQRTALGEQPTRQHAVEALRAQAARIGAHAIIMVSFGDAGMGLWSYHELKGQGRAIRFR